ncbi:hypothetical protein [Clostridium gasigenes]|uniref:hypothetical protein n=1 Tax=Clostridium gasigenes TaxID=94869 RepID=UPI001C0D5C07|nr:hypothetical protein [Clostridium gasigenes]MBU3104409.1 hypothetical protein [Clostridium gasigenes]MBU3136957.1 hypothetical protein [Clostridium gasigenes]
MDSNIIVDLHVHTPSSSDFKGEKNESNYLDIIRLAKEEKVDIIAIADHFSVKGFIEIDRLKEQNKSLSSLLQKTEIYNDQAISDKIGETRELFESVHILMGIEVNISPGIHYIIIFKEDVNAKEVEEFLIDIDVNIENNFGSAKYMIEITSIDFFARIKKSFNERCFIYAPHANQNKGVVKALEGQARENILKDENLSCIGFNQETDRAYIKENIMTHIKRKNNIAFIQDSDYHGKTGQNIGEMCFYIDKKGNNIMSFDMVLANIKSNDNMKTSVDTLKERYDKFIDNKNIFIFEKVDFINGGLVNKEKFFETTCAILNMDTKNNLIQFEGEIDLELQKREIIENFLEIISTELRNKNLFAKSLTIFPYQLSKSKHKLVLQLKGKNRLNLIDGRCYVIDKDQTVIVAEANIIESIVAENIYNKFGKNTDAKMGKISQQCESQKQELKSYSVIYKIIDRIKLLNDIKVENVKMSEKYQLLKNTLEEYTNGNSTGNTIIFEPGYLKGIKGGRFNDCYIRLTPPIYNTYIESDNKVNANTILLTQYGGVLLVKEECFIESNILIVKILLKNNDIEVEILVAYLRSSLFQWIICKNYVKEDLFHFIITLKDVRIPILDLLKEGTHDSLKKYIDELVNLEKNFIVEQERLFKKLGKQKETSEYEKKIEAVASKHNKKAEVIMNEIDEYLFDLCGLNNEDKIQIFKDLKSLKIYNWGKVE